MLYALYNFVFATFIAQFPVKDVTSKSMSFGGKMSCCVLPIKCPHWATIRYGLEALEAVSATHPK